MTGRHRAPVEHHVGRVLTGGGLIAAVATGSVALGPAVASATTVAAPHAAPALAAVTTPLRQAPSAGTVTVAGGDTLSRIGVRVGEAWQQLYSDNQGVVGANPNLIYPGQVLTLSGGTAPATQAAATPAPAPAARHANITNSAGPVRAVTQAGADAIVSNVPGASSITLGGTRASAIDPHGHPAGLAVDYMVEGNTALGHAIVDYTVAHWAELHIEYVIYQQHILLSPGGSWQLMEDRGSPTANHMDHVHINYVG